MPDPDTTNDDKAPEAPSPIAPSVPKEAFDRRKFAKMAKDAAREEVRKEQK